MAVDIPPPPPAMVGQAQKPSTPLTPEEQAVLTIIEQMQKQIDAWGPHGGTPEEALGHRGRSRVRPDRGHSR